MATSDAADALVAALLELERYVGRDGWDQPPRLFALVLTDVLAEAEPALSRELGLRTTESGVAISSAAAGQARRACSGSPAR